MRDARVGSGRMFGGFSGSRATGVPEREPPENAERGRATEERAAELARANAALREAANLLAGAPDLRQFLQQTLVAIAREAHAAAGRDRDRFVVTASAGVGSDLDELAARGVDRAVVFLRPPFATSVARAADMARR